MVESTQNRKVYNYVIKNIKSNRWNIGDKIFSEKELCQELKVSRIAVREALEQCSALGILEKKRGAGTYVSEIDINNILRNIFPLISLNMKDLMHVLNFRLYFEPGNICEFLKNCKDEDIQEMEGTYQRMYEKVGQNKEFYVADYEFHKLIAKGTMNPIVISISDIMTGILIASQELINLKIGPEIGLKYHNEIIKAIKNRDEQLASLLLTRHIEATIKCLEDASQGIIENKSN